MAPVGRCCCGLSWRLVARSVGVAAASLVALCALGVVEAPFSLEGAAEKVFPGLKLRLQRRERRPPAAPVSGLSTLKGESVAESKHLELNGKPDVPQKEPQRADGENLGAATVLPKKSVVLLHGIMSCSKPDYDAMTKAQLDTWASNLSRQQLIIAGGKFDDKDAGIPLVPEFPCSDSILDAACKEGLILWRAVQRYQSLQADWLVLSQDDKYISNDALEKAMEAHDSSKPFVIGGFGCGRSWRYNPDSLGGKKPKPPGWVDPPMSCEAVWQNGGLCGGGTYLVSKGALQLLVTPNQTVEEFKKEYLTPSAHRASDLVSSCLFYSRKIPMSASVDVVGKFAVFDVTGIRSRSDAHVKVKQFRKHNHERPLTVHFPGPKKFIADAIHAFHEEWR